MLLYQISIWKANLESELRQILSKLVNKDKNIDREHENLIEQIKNEELKGDIIVGMKKKIFMISVIF